MTIRISRVRKVNKMPKFPHQHGHGFGSIFQLIVGIILWVGLIIIFAITAWALWFNTSLAYLFSKPADTFPWWFGLLCTLFIFPVTVFVILVSFLVKTLASK